MYSSTVLKYNVEVVVLQVFPFSATLYFYSTTSQREMLYFLLYYIYLTARVGLLFRSRLY